MTIYQETISFIESFEDFLRENNDEYKEGEFDNDEFVTMIKQELDGYIFDLSIRDIEEIIMEYGIGKAIRDYYHLLNNVDDEDECIESQLAYHIMFDNLQNYYEKIKKTLYQIWNE